jgi:hypothetical protein
MDPTHEFWKQSAPPVYRVNVATTQADFTIETRRD